MRVSTRTRHQREPSVCDSERGLCEEAAQSVGGESVSGRVDGGGWLGEEEEEGMDRYARAGREG